jgi:hypothetical protein
VRLEEWLKMKILKLPSPLSLPPLRRLDRRLDTELESAVAAKILNAALDAPLPGRS